MTSGRVDASITNRPPIGTPLRSRSWTKVQYERNDVTIEIVIGALAQVRADVIVDPANATLLARSGVSLALAEQAGDKYRTECADYIRRHGCLHSTTVCTTGPGRLSARWVIHAVSARANEHGNEDDLVNKVMMTYLNALDEADRLRARSIAIPAIGIDAFSVPLQISAEAAATAAILMADGAGSIENKLTLLQFVLQDIEQATAFAEAFQRLGLHQSNANASDEFDRWHDAAVADEVLTDYYQEINTRKTVPAVTAVTTGAGSGQNLGYVDPTEALQRELRAAREEIARLQNAGMRMDDAASDVDSHVTSVSEQTSIWATEVTRSYRDGRSVDAGTGNKHAQGKQAQIGSQHNRQVRSWSSYHQYSAIPQPIATTTSVIQQPTTTGSNHSHRRDRNHSLSRRQSPQNRFNFKPNPYSGDGYVEQYLRQFKCGAETAGWPKEEWGLRLITLLEGRARRIISENYLPDGEKPSFERVASLLRESFASDASPDVWLTMLENRRRQKRESLTELSQIITELVAKAFPGTGMSERQRMAIGYFARALEPALSLHTLASRPTSLADALQTALAYENASRVGKLEATRNANGRESRIQALNSDKQEVHSPFENSFETSAEPASDKRRGRGRGGKQTATLHDTTKEDICQLCDQKGHTARKCLKGREVIQVPLTDNVRPREDRELRDRLRDLERQMYQMSAQKDSSALPKPAATQEHAAQSSQPYAPGSCYRCGDPGHWADKCPQPRSTQFNRGRGRGQGRGAGNGNGRGGSSQPSGLSQ
jgi:O-acetyl-ADP-ribose deacetylase (regulator of RNase III)